MFNIPSIKRFLLLAIITLVSIVWAVSALLNFNASQEQVEELFDAELAQMSRVLQAVIVTNIKLNTKEAPQPLEYLDIQLLDDALGHQEYNELGHKYEKKLSFQVWDAQGKIFFENHNELPKLFGQLHPGFQTIATDQLEWRSFTLEDEDYGFWIKVAQQEDVRTELTNKIAWNTTWPSFAMLPFLVVVLGWIIQKGLSPLRSISNELKGRDYLNLSELNESDYPKELKHMVSELNDLFARVGNSYERERRFTADAAHELRTPLSISKVHLQNIQQVNKDEQISDFVEKALTGIERLIHMVQQLLILSRLEAGQEPETLSTVNLPALCEELVLEISHTQHFTPERVQCQYCDQVLLTTNETSLRILIRNLLDNACRYATKNTSIDLILNAHKLIIRNICPALETTQFDQLFERFKRGNSTQQGSGLGLSICQQICQQNDYTLTISNRTDGPEGIEVRLEFNTNDTNESLAENRN